MRSLGNMFISDVNVDRLAPDHQLVWEGIMNINNNKQSHTSNIGMSIVTGVVMFMALYALISVFEFQPVTNFFLAGMSLVLSVLCAVAVGCTNYTSISDKMEKFISDNLDFILIDGFSRDSTIAYLFKGKDLTQSVNLKFTDRIVGIRLGETLYKKIKPSVTYDDRKGSGNIRLKAEIWDHTLKHGSFADSDSIVAATEFETLMVLEMLAQHSGLQLNVEWDRHQKRPILSLV